MSQIYLKEFQSSGSRSFSLHMAILRMHIWPGKEIGGNIFGFVRFRNVVDILSLESQLNSVKIEGLVLSINVAKYNKGGNKQELQGVRHACSDVNTAPTPHGRPCTMQVKGRTAAKSSYMEALTGSNNVGILKLPQREPVIPKWWKEYSIYGQTKDLAMLEEIVTIIDSTGLNGGIIKYIGGLSILITFSSPAFAKKFLDKKVELLRWFNVIELWNGQSYEFERVAAIKIFGVPAMLWDPEFFNLIGERLGKVLLGSSASYNDCNLLFENLLILTSSMGRINEKISIEWRGQRFNVQVIEGEATWTPSFLEISPEKSGGHKEDDESNIDLGGRAWNRSSRHNEDREEGEIFEHNHEGVNSEVVGFDQNLVSNLKYPAVNSVDNISVGPIPENSILENPISNNVTILSPSLGPLNVIPDSGPDPIRHRKRPRLDDGEDPNLSSVPMVSIMTRLDIQSLTPDLNLPPFGSIYHV
ncbi:hypothetical protein R6Q59_002615 [Mikania micrantha]